MKSTYQGTAAILPVEESANAKSLPVDVPNEKGGVPPCKWLQVPFALSEIGNPFFSHGDIATTGPLDPCDRGHQHHPRPARNRQCCSVILDDSEGPC